MQLFTSRSTIAKSILPTEPYSVIEYLYCMRKNFHEACIFSIFAVFLAELERREVDAKS